MWKVRVHYTDFMFEDIDKAGKFAEQCVEHVSGEDEIDIRIQYVKEDKGDE